MSTFLQMLVTGTSCQQQLVSRNERTFVAITANCKLHIYRYSQIPLQIDFPMHSI